MAKPEEEKSNGLEIISIGALYSGPWDKKYWSSSRGKDRYPYPVGYKAVRAHNGITYKIEVREGLKGPLFSIATTDGQPCSGQTPDIAWQSFQKKGCPRIKLLHGKRFSCDIDGVEFFGFKNSFVQRLLRELVANVGGTAEQSFLPSSFGNGNSGTMHNSQCKESSPGPDLLPQIKGKKRRKGKTINFKSTCGASLKKPRPEDLMHGNDSADSRQGSQCYLNDGPSAASLNLETAVRRENHPLLVKDGLPFELSHCSDHLKEVPPQKESNLVTSKHVIANGLAGHLSKHDQLLDRSEDAQTWMLTSSMVSEDKDGEVPVPKEAQNMNDKDLCAPDSLDVLHGGTQSRTSLSAIQYSMVFSSDVSPNDQQNGLKESHCNGKYVLNAGELVISVGLAPELHPPEEMGTLGSSEKSDVDSVGQDIANSMMKVLLPRALPLLKTFSRKKRTIIEQKQKENNETDRHAEVASPAEVHTQRSPIDQQEKDKMHIVNKNPGAVVASLGQNGPVVPDSFENDQSGSDVADAGLTAKDESISRSDTLAIPVDATCQSSSCQVRSSDGIVDGNCTSMVSPVKVSHKEISVRKGNDGTGNTSFTEIQNEASSTRKHNGPLTESIICRSFNDGYSHDTYTAENFLLASEIQPASSFNDNPDSRVSSGVDIRLERQADSLHLQKRTKNVNGVTHNVAPVLQQNPALLGPSNFANTLDILDQSASRIEKSHAQVDKELQGHQNIVDISNSVLQVQEQGMMVSLHNSEIADGSNLNPKMSMCHDDRPEGTLEFVGCYVHPLPVSLVLLSTKENGICICVLCGDDDSRTLFMYEVALKEHGAGFPSFIGHTTILFPTSTDAFGRKIQLERSGLQFTPGGQSLVLLKSVKAPYCREGKMQCLCSVCRSDSFEKNAVKVVQVKHGYVSVVVNLKIIDNVRCLLVCEPNYLVCVEESGTLHLWVMNSTWSAQIEECDLCTSDCIFPCIVELKRIPNCAALVVGHNGFGEFGIWDISNRTFVARFSSPSTSVFQFLPISLFRWQSKGHDDYISNIMATTKASFSERGENHVSIPIEVEDVAVWLFISTVCTSDPQYDLRSTDNKINPVGLWRLALLVKNRVILGSALDARAAAIGASAGHGIIGTGDGLVYIWDLCTGTKLQDLQCFKGVGVSCIVNNGSRSGPMAVAGGGKLKVYHFLVPGDVRSRVYILIDLCMALTYMETTACCEKQRYTTKTNFDCKAL